MTREAVVVVPENAAAGKVNGKQLAATAPLHGQPRALSAEAWRTTTHCPEPERREAPKLGPDAV